MLDPDREPDVAGRHAGQELVVGRELAVGGRGRVDGERARVADVGDVMEQLERIDEGPAGLPSALQLEPDQAAIAALEHGIGPAARLAALQPGEDDGADLGMP